MCGIFFSCSLKEPELPSQNCLQSLERRGPDCVNCVSRLITARSVSPEDSSSTKQGAHCISLTFLSTVLSLRGDSITSQPLEDPDYGSLLCWNGEGWKTRTQVIDGNDAKTLFEQLIKATEPPSSGETLQNVINVIESIVGPYAFVFYDARHHRVFYGRDTLGRRSLVVRKGQHDSFVISSICDTACLTEWKEVNADGIYMVDLQDDVGSLIMPTINISHIPRAKNRVPMFPALNSDKKVTTNPALALHSPAVKRLSQELQNSLILRLKGVPRPPSSVPNAARVAILFSGGVDCTVLARLAHEILPKDQEIDLLNVAFENPRVIQAASLDLSLGEHCAFSLCPDRNTGMSSHAEILRTCKGRTWRFVAVDITYVELQEHRPQIVSLIHPHNTEMDFSIACALYFAARGKGTAVEAFEHVKMPYSTPARVLLSGLGADELFGGYTRHATAFNRKGYAGLIDELQLDFDRLGKRNLGRDDRVICHWGKEVRYPYLDEDLVRWALSIPVWEKCGFGENSQVDDSNLLAIEPGKKVLRLLSWKLGLKGAALRKKTAIQFGARTAKMESGKTKGTAILS